MTYGICLLSIIPCRREPVGTSEMVTQLLFGETYQVDESREDWLLITTSADQYQCWISSKQFTRLSEATYRKIKSVPAAYTSELVQIVTDNDRQIHFPVTMGSSLPLEVDGQLMIDERSFSIDGPIVHADKKKNAGQIVETAFTLLHAPYLWGGRSPFGIDCSGFVQLVYRLNGYKLPRDAYQQVENGTPLSFVEEAEAGDLAYFDNEEGRIVHVGIILDNQQIIHASGSVRVDRYDHYGIFNKEAGKYSHNMRVIKRILS